MKDKKHNNILNKNEIITLCFLFMVLTLVASIVVAFNNRNNHNLYNKDHKYSIDIYKNESGILCGRYHEESCNILALSVPVDNDDVRLLDYKGTYNNGYILYMEKNKIKIYGTKNNNVKVLNNLDISYKNYYIIMKNDVIGISYNNNNYKNIISNECKFYDIKDGKNKYDKYCIIDSIDNTNYLEAVNNVKYISDMEYLYYDNFLIDINTGNAIINEENDSKCGRYSINGSFIVHTDTCNDLSSKKYYTINGKLINEINNQYLIDQYDNKLYFYENDTIYVVDKDGNIVSTNKFNGYKIELISRNYVVAIKDNKLVMINLDDFKEYEIIDWDSNYYFNYMVSGYVENNNKNGYYLIIDYNNKEPYKELFFDPNTKEVK